jgi:alpha-glucoside transport system ATP-binding protein
MADLKLTNVAKTYGGTVDVLKDINLDIHLAADGGGA